MSGRRPVLYFDFGSPYAYLAIERAEAVLGCAVELQPVLLGAIFGRRGWGSWAETHEREAGIRQVEERAGRYGLPPISWPDGWPLSSLAADRAAVWAKGQGAVVAFTRALFRREFVSGADISDVRVLGAAAVEAGLGAAQLEREIQRQEIKDALRDATDRAWEVGVGGVPSLLVRGRVFYGDDRLEEAAAHLTAS